jgi:hypothetical protein
MLSTVIYWIKFEIQFRSLIIPQIASQRSTLTWFSFELIKQKENSLKGRLFITSVTRETYLHSNLAGQA